jgi:hypothetical protein
MAGHVHNIKLDLKPNTATTVIYPVHVQQYFSTQGTGGTTISLINRFSILQALLAGSVDGAGVGDVTQFGMVPTANIIGSAAPKTGLKIVIAVRKPGVSPDYVVTEKVSNATTSTVITPAVINSALLNAAATLGSVVSSDGMFMKIALSASDVDTVGMLEIRVGIRDSSDRTAWVFEPLVLNVGDSDVTVIRKAVANSTKVDPNTNTYTVYEDDGATPNLVYDLYNKAGRPSTTSISERKKR